MSAHTKTHLDEEEAYVTIRRPGGRPDVSHPVSLAKADEIEASAAEDEYVDYRDVFGAEIDALGGEGVLRLRHLRKALGFTQKALADAIGESPGHMSEYERGKRTISKNVAQRLGKVLKQDYRAFL